MPSYPYEILFRLNRDGTIRGAHYKDLRVIQEPGFPDEEREGEAQPVAAGITKAGIPLDTILGQVAAALQATYEEQAATIANQEAELKAKDANIQDLMARCERLQIVVDTFAAESQADTPAVSADEAAPAAPAHAEAPAAPATEAPAADPAPESTVLDTQAAASDAAPIP